MIVETYRGRFQNGKGISIKANTGGGESFYPPWKARYTIAKKQRGRPIEYEPGEDLHRGANAARYCICGKALPIKWRLCPDCFKVYGHKAKQWPEWLRDWSQSVNNEINQERRHLDLELFDEYSTDVIEGARMSKPVDVSTSYNMSKPEGMKWNVSATRTIAINAERETMEKHLWLNQFLSTLSTRELDIINRHFYDDLTQAEIGKAMGISQAMVSKIIAGVIKKARNGSN